MTVYVLLVGFGLHTVSAIYGETINIPCGQDVTQDLLFGKWKYVSVSLVFSLVKYCFYPWLV